MRTFVLMFVALLAVPAPIFAWHKYGHMAVARIAWQQLDAKERKRVDEILKAHVHDGIDHRQVYLLADLPKDAIPANEWAFARAAVWSDWIRDPSWETANISAAHSASIKKRFHKGPWHYINLPHVHPADAEFIGATKLAEMRKALLEPEFVKVKGKDEPRHIVAALKHAMNNLRHPKSTDAEKAVALCWLMHLVGDVHQPMHATGLIARAQSLPKTKFNPPPYFEAPEGDRGGNLVAVKPAKDAAAQNLHFYWDALIFDDRKNFVETDARFQELCRHPDYQPDKLPELKNQDFLAWAEESHELAKNVAYRTTGTATGAFLDATPLPKTLSYAQTNQLLKTLDAPVLQPEYRQNATRTAERRLVVAGYRLAVQIKAALSEARRQGK